MAVKCRQTATKGQEDLTHIESIKATATAMFGWSVIYRFAWQTFQCVPCFFRFHLRSVGKVVEDAEARAVAGKGMMRAAGHVARQAALQCQLGRQQRAYGACITVAGST